MSPTLIGRFFTTQATCEALSNGKCLLSVWKSRKSWCKIFIWFDYFWFEYCYDCSSQQGQYLILKGHVGICAVIPWLLLCGGQGGERLHALKCMRYSCSRENYCPIDLVTSHWRLMYVRKSIYDVLSPELSSDTKNSIYVFFPLKNWGIISISYNSPL